MDPEFAAKPIQAQPNRAHRRTQSETFFRFPEFDDDSLLNDVVSDFNIQFPNQTLQSPNQQLPTNPIEELSQLSHYRSLSVDADFFAGLDIGGATWNSLAETAGEAAHHHRRSNSIDGSTSASSFEAVDSSKKAMAPEKLAELALSDPQKAKRILANRQSAARSKERKVRYTSELERKVQTLQAEATTLSTQVTKLQRDTTGLTAENKELTMRLEALEQQSHLRDALNEALKEELKHLKILAGEIQVVNGNGSLYYAQPHAINSFRGSQPQYAQQQKQQQLPCPTDANPNLSRQPQPDFRGFNQRV